MGDLISSSTPPPIPQPVVPLPGVVVPVAGSDAHGASAVGYYVAPPRPPAPTVWDVLAGTFAAAVGALFAFGAVAGGLGSAIDAGSLAAGLVSMAAFALFCGGPAVALFYCAHSAFTRARREWRKSPRTQRRVCLACGHDLRGDSAVGDRCPVCGAAIPEPIECTVAKLERMMRGERGRG